MDPLVARVLDRWAREYHRNKDLIPAWSDESDRIVYVKPESVGEDYEKVPSSKLDDEGHLADPRRPGGKRLRKLPRRPHKPRIPRHPPPVPPSPPRPRPHALPPKRPKKVPLVPRPKVPKPSPFKDFKHQRKFDYRWSTGCPEKDLVIRVVARHLAGLAVTEAEVPTEELRPPT